MKSRVIENQVAPRARSLQCFVGSELLARPEYDSGYGKRARQGFSGEEYANAYGRLHRTLVNVAFFVLVL